MNMGKAVRARRLLLPIRWALLAGALGVVACQPQPGAPAADPGAAPVPAGLGSVTFELTIGGVFQFDQVSYDISGNGFHEAADLNVADSTAVSAVVSGIPSGAGYTVKLTAQDTAHRLTPCTGMSTFDVTSSATVPVPVHLTCRALSQVVASVPVPRSATVALALVLLALGAAHMRPDPRRKDL
jgi:hypothetical protein